MLFFFWMLCCSASCTLCHPSPSPLMLFFFFCIPLSCYWILLQSCLGCTWTAWNCVHLKDVSQVSPPGVVRVRQWCVPPSERATQHCVWSAGQSSLPNGRLSCLRVMTLSRAFRTRTYWHGAVCVSAYKSPCDCDPQPLKEVAELYVCGTFIPLYVRRTSIYLAKSEWSGPIVKVARF